jgi:PilZ domain
MAVYLREPYTERYTSSQGSTVTPMYSREHRRVQMRLPARLRWSTPLGQRIELGKTIDASRGGLLVSIKERHTPGVTVWVTFPYDASLADGQPEVVARVVRCDEVLEVIRTTSAREKVQTKNGSEQERSTKLDQLACAVGLADVPAAFAVAVQFESRNGNQSRGAFNGDFHRKEFERRGTPRRALAVPIHVRPREIPWFEEAMTIDYSAKSMRFRSHREYQPGEQLKIAFEDSVSAPWTGAGEFLSEVVRVAPGPESTALEVSVYRIE